MLTLSLIRRLSIDLLRKSRPQRTDNRNPRLIPLEPMWLQRQMLVSSMIVSTPPNRYSVHSIRSWIRLRLFGLCHCATTFTLFTVRAFCTKHAQRASCKSTNMQKGDSNHVFVMWSLTLTDSTFLSIPSSCLKQRLTFGPVNSRGGDTRGSIKRMIIDTIDRLQKASACSNDVGDRYSRLIRLLWRKPPGRLSIAEGADITRPGTASGRQSVSINEQGEQIVPEPGGIGSFSWLDLGAIGDFAVTNNESIAGSFDGMDRFDDSSTDGFAGFEMMPQYNWNGMSPTGIIF